MVVEDGRPADIDMAKLARDAESARARLKKANRSHEALFGRLETIVDRFCPGLARVPYHIDRFAGGHHAHYAAP